MAWYLAKHKDKFTFTLPLNAFVVTRGLYFREGFHKGTGTAQWYSS